MTQATLCGKYLGDNDGTCPQLTCIRAKHHDGGCDNVRGDTFDPDLTEQAFWRFDALHKAHYRNVAASLPGPMSERDAFKSAVRWLFDSRERSPATQDAKFMEDALAEVGPYRWCDSECRAGEATACGPCAREHRWMARYRALLEKGAG